jgi:hypothetical protein
MSVVENSAKGFNSPLELPSYRRGSDDVSTCSQATTNHVRNHVARLLFDNDRLDRQLKRHHVTCEFIDSTILFGY